MRPSLTRSRQTFVHELLLDETQPPLQEKTWSHVKRVNRTWTGSTELDPSQQCLNPIWTHLAGFVCVWVEHAVTQPQARLLADLLQVHLHGLWNPVLALLALLARQLSQCVINLRKRRRSWNYVDPQTFTVQFLIPNIWHELENWGKMSEPRDKTQTSSAGPRWDVVKMSWSITRFRSWLS